MIAQSLEVALGLGDHANGRQTVAQVAHADSVAIVVVEHALHGGKEFVHLLLGAPGALLSGVMHGNFSGLGC
jgi:hypothetical protein